MKPVVKIIAVAGLGVGLIASLAIGLGLTRPQTAPGSAASVDLVNIPAGTIDYRPFGNFVAKGKSRSPRAYKLEVAGFTIMKYQVSRAEYAACVADGPCASVPTTGGDYPQTYVNWKDANDYARWYSQKTGEHWRLPSDAEWQLAAAERYGDAAPDTLELDPGQRMLAQYSAGTLLRGTASPALRPAGGFGENSLGLADISGNVWEWTDGCMQSGSLRADGAVAESEPYCWVRIAGGIHRAAIVSFIRDASVGGCAVGLPPNHLGFRLVRDTLPARWWQLF
ncbi:formylglycine-generating enzyme family protein [Pseudophaeobacter sp.]|uniref:formylglycine-generating enzyme family protein n=1 Tax=Pseudophaeobacter sp. TaxID=1971739 RepID=UPI003A980955